MGRGVPLERLAYGGDCDVEGLVLGETLQPAGIAATGTIALLAKMRMKNGRMPAACAVSGSLVATPIAAYIQQKAHPKTTISTRPRELIVGALPLLFALHQFVEAFVWLGLRGPVSSTLRTSATEIYVVYAYAILPMIVPLGFLLIEPSRRHRRGLLPFAALGIGVGGYLLWQVTQYPIQATANAQCVSCRTHTPYGDLLAIGYVIATCGPALLSSRRYLRWFGLANLFGAVVAASVERVALTSI